MVVGERREQEDLPPPYSSTESDFSMSVNLNFMFDVPYLLHNVHKTYVENSCYFVLNFERNPNCINRI